MKRFILLLCVPFTLTAGLGAQEKGKTPKPMFTIGKETTYVIEPVTKDGHIDYVTALNERLREGVTPENYANVLLWQAFGPHPDGATMPAKFFEWMKMEQPPEAGDYLVRQDTFAFKHLKLSQAEATKFFDACDDATARPWSAKQYPQVADWLKANEKPLALVHKAVQRTHYYSPLQPDGEKPERRMLIGALMPGVQQCRQLAAALTARAMLRVSEGKTDDAWQDLLACHRLARHVGKGATLIDGLVGLAVNSIAASADLAFIDAGKLEPKKLKGCLGDLQALPPLPLMADKVNLGERFIFLDTVMFMDRNGVESMLNEQIVPKKTSGAIHWDHALRSGNQMYTRLHMIMRLKDRAVREKQFHEFNMEIKSLKQESTSPGGMAKALFSTGSMPQAVGKIVGDNLVCLLAPAVEKVQNAADRGEQIQRNLHIAFALAAYRADEKRYPKSLDLLAPKFLPEVPNDLFSGKALIYRPNDTGYLLYSIGINGQDDQGRGYEDDPPADDLPVRMPLPAPRKK